MATKTTVTAGGRWDGSATMTAVTAAAAGRLKVARPAGGLGVPKAIPRRLAAAGKAVATARAAGTAIPRGILRPRVAAGIIRATAKAVGTVILKATRKRHAGVGKAARVVARPATRSVLSATTRCSPAAALGMTMIGIIVAAMTTSVAMAGAAMAAGPATRKAIPKPRGAAGRPVADQPRKRHQERPSESLDASFFDMESDHDRGTWRKLIRERYAPSRGNSFSRVQERPPSPSSRQWGRPRHARGLGVVARGRGIRDPGRCDEGLWRSRSGPSDRDY